jgi:tRNA 5-methylaminomethyl-2-thiouridine biosynthesis bifunctional protein
VYDSQPSPAGGAAGLPVGLVVPHHSADDSARSRMSRAGTRLMLQHAEERLNLGADWQPGGVLELSIEDTGLAEVEAEVLSHAAPQRAPTGWASHRALGSAQGLWHPYAAWIKPARLVQCWLDNPAIHFYGSATVHSLQRVEQQWLLHCAQGSELGRADLVVFANAYGCVELVRRLAASVPAVVDWIPDALEKLQSLQAMQGTLSLGPCLAPLDGSTAVFPGFPVNGHGSFVSGVPTAQGLQWYAGSTFQTNAILHADLVREHGINLKKLQALLPAVAEQLAPQFTNQQVQAWQGTRCISHDRLPLVGPLDDTPKSTLWLCAAMGARGLSFSALCAELLAAWLGDEPLPIESALAKGLGTRRLRRKSRS